MFLFGDHRCNAVGIGLLCSDWLCFGGSVNMVGRSGTLSGQIRGPNLRHIIMADVSRNADFSHSLELGRERNKAIFHSSGLTRDIGIFQQLPSSIRSVTAPKEKPLQLLKTTPELASIEGIWLFSSISAVFGTKGQSNYASSNMYLEGWAASIAKAGICSSSIAWGAWSTVGMASHRKDILRKVEVSGLGLIHPDTGLEIITKLLPSSGYVANVIATPLDIPKITGSFAKREPDLFGRHGIVRRPLSMLEPNSDRNSLLYIKETVMRTLNAIVSKELREDEPLFQAGITSLSSIELKLELAQLFEINIPSTFIFDYPTANSIILYLTETLNDKGTPLSVSPRTYPADTGKEEGVSVLGMKSLSASEGGINIPLDESLMLNKDKQSSVPPCRWDFNKLLLSDFESIMSLSTHFGVFLDKIEYFDATLFRIADSQASHIDPQQRMLLECSLDEFNGIDCGEKKKTGRE